MRKSSGFTLMVSGFNTDDGIRRAAIMPSGMVVQPSGRRVSIPMTVLGGLQFGGALALKGTGVVSIPMTVLGGLQYPPR